MCFFVKFVEVIISHVHLGHLLAVNFIAIIIIVIINPFAALHAGYFRQRK